MRNYRTYREVIIERLKKDPEEAFLYLKFSFEEFSEDNNTGALLSALRTVAEAQGGIPELARRIGMEKMTLYEALSKEGNPKLKFPQFSGSSSLLVQSFNYVLIVFMKPQALISELLGGMPWLAIRGIEVNGKQIDIQAQSLQKESNCPCCGVVSKSIHSHYERTLLDLPWAAYGVRLHLAVRRFRCREKHCERSIFTERFSTWIHSYARRMARVWETVKEMNIETSSNSTARLSQHLHMPASSSAILRKLHALKLPDVKKASVIGVDDFAFTRSQSYGTLIVDLENNQPIDMLPDRMARTLAIWLKAHPEVTIIARDRGAEYANGISQGAAKAKQVLDRWHLLKNLTEALERVVQQQQQAITKVAKTWGVQPRQRTKNEELAREQNREQRQQRYQAIRSLHEKGRNLSEIQRELGFHPSTIRRAIAGDALPERHANHTAPSIAFFNPLLAISSNVGQKALAMPPSFGVILKPKGIQEQPSKFCVGRRSGEKYLSNIGRLTPIP